MRHEAALAIRYRRSGSALRQVKAYHSTSVEYKAAFFRHPELRIALREHDNFRTPAIHKRFSAPKVLGMSIAHSSFQQ